MVGHFNQDPLMPRSIPQRFSFYAKALLLLILINTLFCLILGTYFEEYEGVNSASIMGLYTHPCRNFADFSNHYLIIRLYEYLSWQFPQIQVYGWFMFAYNWISSLLMGLVLFRILKVNLSLDNWLLFVLLYLLLAADNLLNLSSTRITFVSITTLFAYIESCRLNGEQIGLKARTLLIVLMLFITLMRAEAVMLSTMLYLFILIVNKRFYTLSLLPLIAGIAVFLSFNYVVTHCVNTEEKLVVFKEKEILDRTNIDFDKLVPGSALQLEVEAITEHALFDKVHFTPAFYDAIAYSRGSIGLKSITDGLKPISFLHTLLNSAMESYPVWRMLLFYLFSCLLLLRVRKQLQPFRAYWLLGFIPLLICFYTIVPLRFLMPFYAVLACLNLFLYIRKEGPGSRVLAGIFLCCCLVMYGEAGKSRYYQLKYDKFHKFQLHLQALNRKRPDVPAVIYNADFEKIFPVRPLEKLVHPNTLLLNFYWYIAYDFYREKWKEYCHCDPLSIKDKTDYLVSTQAPLIIDTASLHFMQKYFKSKYAVGVEGRGFTRFDEESGVCTLEYTPLNETDHLTKAE